MNSTTNETDGWNHFGSKPDLNYITVFQGFVNPVCLFFPILLIQADFRFEKCSKKEPYPTFKVSLKLGLRDASIAGSSYLLQFFLFPFKIKAAPKVSIRSREQVAMPQRMTNGMLVSA